MAKYQRKDWEQEYQKLAKEARKLAKRANQRMVRLERYAQEKAFQGALDFAYDIAQKKIKALYAKEGPKLRFNERYPTEENKLSQVSDGTKYLTGQDLYRQNVYMLRHKINAMQEFLESESSTKGVIYKIDPATGKAVRRYNPETGKNEAVIEKEGLKSVYDKRAYTISTASKFGLTDQGFSVTASDLQRFFESKKQARLQKAVGSLNMFVVAAVIRDNKIASNKRDLTKFLRDNIDMKKFKDAGKDLNDINSKNYSSYKDMIDDLWKFVDLTGDKMLNKAIGDALKAGVNYENIFI